MRDRIRYEAADRHGGLSLDELRAFVAELDAAGCAGTAPVRGKARRGGRLRAVSATVVRLGGSCRPGPHPSRRE